MCLADRAIKHLTDDPIDDPIDIQGPECLSSKSILFRYLGFPLFFCLIQG